MNIKYHSYLEKIRNQKDEMVSLLTDWSCQNSYTNNPQGLKKMINLLDNHFKSLGGKSKKLNLKPRLIVDDEGEISQYTQSKALHIIKRSKSPLRVFLGGHMDTVFPPESPFQKAVRHGSRLNGPGVADMKGGLLILYKALEALESSPWADQIGWEILITPDEEVGSSGSEHLYRAAAANNHVGLIFEPSFPDGSLVSSRKGSLGIVATAQGKSAHVGRDFFDGRNAVTALAKWVLGVEQMTDPKKGITVNIGQLKGGNAFNIVPDKAFAKVNIRTDHLEDEKLVVECLNILTEEANAVEGINLKIDILASRSPKTISQGTEHLFSLYRECANTMGVPLSWKPTGGVCDGNILASCGLPTIDTLGAVGGQLHTDQEYIEIDSLTERTCLTTLFLLKLASGELEFPCTHEVVT